MDKEEELHYFQTKMNVVVFRPDPQPFNIYRVHVMTEPNMNVVFQMDDTQADHVRTLRDALETELVNKRNVLRNRLARIINSLEEEDQEYAVFFNCKARI